jgi:hypothetical protein
MSILRPEYTPEQQEQNRESLKKAIIGIINDFLIEMTTCTGALIHEISLRQEEYSVFKADGDSFILETDVGPITIKKESKMVKETYNVVGTACNLDKVDNPIEEIVYVSDLNSFEEAMQFIENFEEKYLLEIKKYYRKVQQ